MFREFHIVLENSRKALHSHSPSPSVSKDSYLRENMEEQIRILRAANAELKRAIARLYSLAQATHTEVRNENNLMSGRITTISET